MSEELSTVFEFEGDVNEAKAPEPLPEGEYPATVQGVEIKKSQSGKPVAHIAMLISASAYPPDYADGDPDGTAIKDYRTIHVEKRLWFLNKQMMEAYGVRIKRRGDGTSSLDVADLQGQDVLVTIKHDQYQGRTTAKVSAVRPA